MRSHCNMSNNYHRIHAWPSVDTSVRNKEQIVVGKMSWHYHYELDNFRFAQTYSGEVHHVPQ